LNMVHLFNRLKISLSSMSFAFGRIVITFVITFLLNCNLFMI